MNAVTSSRRWVSCLSSRWSVWLCVAVVMALVRSPLLASDDGGHGHGHSYSSHNSHNRSNAVDKWVTVEASAEGTGPRSEDMAVDFALRKAVEQACGVFLKAQSDVINYQAVYDKVFADTVGFVIEHKVVNRTVGEDRTTVKVKARVSTKKFQKDWAVIAHTVNQENNPRVIIAIVETVQESYDTTPHEITEGGTVQSRLEDFFISRGLQLVDRNLSEEVMKRDLTLAAIKDDVDELAAVGARFKADLVVFGRATVKLGKTIDVADQTMYQYVATLNLRAIQTDSARILTAKSFGPITANSLQQGGGGGKALAKLTDESAPAILGAVVKAWQKRLYVARVIPLSISGMDYDKWRTFNKELSDKQGIKALRLREITQNTANIDVEFESSHEKLADLLYELKTISLKVVEITSNRIKLKVVPPQPDAIDQAY